MSLIDWTIVLTLNLSVVLVGVVLARGTRSSPDRFLGGRSLPWWVVGLSMFATNMDSADLVGVTGQTYREGIHLITVYSLGSALGGVLAAFLIVPSIYRLGYYTNAEYLEARFGVSARVLSALIQLQYRSIMLGMMIWSIYLLLTRLVELPPAIAWVLVVASVIGSGVYTAMGGLKAVVWTDALQGIIMMVGGFVIFTSVWSAVGGWTGMQESLAAAGEVNQVRLEDLSHIGRYQGAEGQTSTFVVMIGWIIIGCGYWTVNHTQTMRLMGVRSLWDMKMAAVFGVGISLPIAVSCAFLGVFGRAIPEFQNLETPDTLYPMLANRYLAPGLKGLVVASVVAAVISTFDSMGSALSAIFTRDIYARLLVRNGDDRHYVLVGRIATVGVLSLGFGYLPFIMAQKNMLNLLTTLIPVFVTPLMTIYIVGVATRVHRRSGLVGLVVGSLYGFFALQDRTFDTFTAVPDWVTNKWPAYAISVAITAVSMLATSLVLGWDDAKAELSFQETGWLGKSREDLPKLRQYPGVSPPPIWLSPSIWATALFAVCIVLQVLLW